MMNILFVVPYVPNLVRVRPFNLIRALSARGHKVTVLTLWTNEQERADIGQLQHYAEVHALPMSRVRSLVNCMRVLPSQTPFQSVFDWQPDLVKAYNSKTTFDVVHVEHLRGTPYALHFKHRLGLPVVWDSVDCITHLFKQAATKSRDRIGRWRSQFDLRRTEWYEGWLLPQFDHVLVTSKVDKQALLELSDPTASAAPITVLPNGVDLNHFYPDTAVSRESATLVVSGKMSYHANVSMVLHLIQDIMPHVWKQKADVQLWIVGKDPTRDIKALAQHPNITVTGTIPAFPPYLQRANIAVAPILYSAGIQNKVLEAMACATPVVTTSKAVAALDLIPDQDVSIADTPVQFAEKIVQLLIDPVKQRTVGEAGLRYVREHHNWDTIASDLEIVYQQAIMQQ